MTPAGPMDLDESGTARRTLVDASILGVTQLPVTARVYDGGDLSQEQRAALEGLLERLPEICKTCEAELLKHYSAARLVELEETDLTEADLPEAPDAESLARVIQPKEFFITSRQPAAGHRIALLCESAWDDEHGLAVLLLDGVVTEIGSQDIAF